MDKIVPAFELSLLDQTLSDACADLIEAGIDSLLDDGVLKSIPIVGILIGVGKTAQNIHDRNLLRQTIRFINSFNEGNVKPEKLEKYKKMIDENSKKAEDELGRVIIILNSNIEIKKSEMLGKMFRAYVNEEIKWNDFCELSDVTNRLFISDIELLLKVIRHEVEDTKQCIPYQAERLNSLGLIEMVVHRISLSTAGNDTAKAIKASSLGERFIHYGIEY